MEVRALTSRRVCQKPPPRVTGAGRNAVRAPAVGRTGPVPGRPAERVRGMVLRFSSGRVRRVVTCSGTRAAGRGEGEGGGRGRTAGARVRRGSRSRSRYGYGGL